MSEATLRAAFNPAPRSLRIVVSAIVICASAVLLFWNLGHYALWDDEAMTALPSLGVWRTGDTVGVIDEKFGDTVVSNVVGYRGGAELKYVGPTAPGGHNPDLRMRYMPPAPNYLAAPFIGLMGRTSFAARLPFTILGLITVALMLYWVWRLRADSLTWIIFALALIGNVSFYLYFRNCRYYGIAILTTTALGYLYLNWAGKIWQVLLFVFLSICLLASNYMNFVALYLCIAIDYAIWGRKRHPISIGQFFAILTPQLVVGAALVYIWNPLSMQVDRVSVGWIDDRLVLLATQLHDVNRSEMLVGTLMIAAAIIAVVKRDQWLIRGLLAGGVYFVVVSIVSPTSWMRALAGCHYLAAIIPLFLAMGIRVVRQLSFGKWIIGISIALASFETDFLHDFGLGEKTILIIQLNNKQVFSNDPIHWHGIRCTLWEYIRELHEKRPDAYNEVIAWIKANVKAGESVAATPQYKLYPMMYHAPQALYAWQFTSDAIDTFPGLDQVQYSPEMNDESKRTFWPILPKYVIAFGNPDNIFTALDTLSANPLTRYKYVRVATIDRFWVDTYRPELVNREFHLHTDFDQKNEAVYIYEKKPKDGN